MGTSGLNMDDIEIEIGGDVTGQVIAGDHNIVISAAPGSTVRLAGVAQPGSRVQMYGEPGIGRSTLDVVADDLAASLLSEWKASATHRRLLKVAAFRPRWAPAEDVITGRVDTAIKTRRFRPVAGVRPIADEDDLRESCEKGLYSVYGGLPSGRLVLTGAPGAGKSSAAILLLVEALEHRKGASDRRDIPVPVIFTMQDWDPITTTVGEWLTTKLADRLGPSPFQRRRRLLAEALLSSNRIAVFLDGLDEMQKGLRPIAIEALNDQATFRLVLLSRREEFNAAASKGILLSAVALQPRPLERGEVIEYATRFLPDPPPNAWRELLTSINDPGSPLAQAFTTPLLASLLFAFRRDDDAVAELVERNFSDQAAVEGHLYDNIIRVAYAPRPGHRARYTPEVVRRSLVLLAHRLGEPSEFAWWDLPTLSVRSGLLRTVVSVVVGSVLGGLLGIVWGVMYRPAHQFMYSQPAGLSDWLLGGLVYGLSFGAAGTFLIEISRQDAQRRAQSARWRRIMSLDLPVLRLVAAVVAGTAAWLVPGGDLGPVGGLTVGVIVAVASGLAAHLANTSAASPISAWRADFRSAVGSGLIFGLVVGFVVGAALVWFRSSSPYWILVGPVLGLPLGLGAGTVHSRVWNTAIAQTYLAVRYRTPLRLIHFLEDTREKLLLRTAGPSYQFMHKTFQDRLAAAAGSPGQAADPAREKRNRVL
jgi:hypothetical protein